MSDVISAERVSRRQVLVWSGMLSLAGCAGTKKPSDAGRQVQINRVEQYLRTVHLNAVPFTQLWPDGATGMGQLTYSPGYLYLFYQDPPGTELKARGLHAVYKDGQNGSETSMGLAHNPLGLLMGNPIVLSGAVMVTDVRQQPGVLQISLARAANPSQGLVTLTFADSNNILSLSDIHVTDERRRTLEVHLLQQG